jgi:hypothetical protein
MVLLRWSSTQFAVELVNALSELRKCLHSSLEEYPADKSAEAVQSSSYTAPADLLSRSVSLDKLYQQAYFELRVGRISGMYDIPSTTPSPIANLQNSQILEAPDYNC